MHPVIRVVGVTRFIKYIYYGNLQFQINIIDSSDELIILYDLWFYCSQTFLLLDFTIFWL